MFTSVVSGMSSSFTDLGQGHSDYNTSVLNNFITSLPTLALVQVLFSPTLVKVTVTFKSL